MKNANKNNGNVKGTKIRCKKQGIKFKNQEIKFQPK